MLGWQGIILRGGGNDEEMRTNSQDEASEEAEPSCTESRERMAALVQGAREQRNGLDDGYALLQDLEDEGLPIGTAVFNEFLRMAVELAKGGNAETVDGERIVERLEYEGLVPDEDTYLQMMLLIGEGARNKVQVARKRFSVSFHGSNICAVQVARHCTKNNRSKNDGYKQK